MANDSIHVKDKNRSTFTLFLVFAALLCTWDMTSYFVQRAIIATRHLHITRS